MSGFRRDVAKMAVVYVEGELGPCSCEALICGHRQEWGGGMCYEGLWQRDEMMPFLESGSRMLVVRWCWLVRMLFSLC